MSRGRPGILTVSILVYAPLGGLGLAWAAWRAGHLTLDVAVGHPEPWWDLGPAAAHGASVGLGLGLALATIGATRVLTRRTAWARELHLAFRELLGVLPRGTVLGLALASGVGEEAFFRLGMQPSVGWVLTSIVFGAVHLGPSRRFWPWTIWAMVMGFALGAIYEATGSLAGPVLAHATINYVNLRFIGAHDPRAPEDRPRTEPRLVARQERR